MAKEENSLEKVMEMDAAFKAAAKSQQLDTIAEGKALLDMMGSQGAHQEMVDKACKSTLSQERWEQCKENHKAWERAGVEATGVAIKAVIEDLDADHLRPTTIYQRLASGNCAPCHGLASLMVHLQSRLPGSFSS